MRRQDRNRFLTALGTALGLHLLLVLVLALLPWDRSGDFERQHPPVTVVLQQASPAERLEEEEREEEPEETPQQAAREGTAPEQQPRPTSQPEQEAPSPEEPRAESPALAPERADTARESAPAQSGSQSERRSAARQAERPAPEPEERPASRQPAPQEEPQVEREQGEDYSPGSRIEYGEEIESSPDRQSTEGAREQPQEQEQSSLFSDEEIGELGRDAGESAAAETGRTGETAGEAAGETATGSADGTRSGSREGVEGEVSVEFSREGEERELLETVQPDLSSEELAELPRRIPLRINFTLKPSGRLTDLNILRGSGDTRVDNKVLRAVRQWRFESVTAAGGDGDGRDATGTITLILRKR